MADVIAIQADGSQGVTTLPDAAPSTPALVYSYQFEYRDDPPGYQRLIDPVTYKDFTGLALQPGVAFPPGYPAKGNPTAFATGLTTGQELIRIQPPISGVGELAFRSGGEAIVDTRGMRTSAEFYFGWGTTSSSVDPDTGHPVYPYEGRHSRRIQGAKLFVVPPGVVWPIAIDPNTLWVHLLSGVGSTGKSLALASWPKWAMVLSDTGYYPALCPIIRNVGTEAFKFGDIWLQGGIS